MTERRAPLLMHGERVPAGTRRRIEIPVARLPTGTWLSLPVVAVHGQRPGPRLWLSGVIHGDEIAGVEIIRRVLERIDPVRLEGTLLAVPIVNVFGFIQQTRTLPDRRDLNRSFPGSARGSLAARLAHLFMHEIVQGCDAGLDFHTASGRRANLPHVRGNLEDERTLKLALAFGAPVAAHARVRDGSLRAAATQQGIPVLVFEGGEPLRFEEDVIQAGVDGTLRVMQALGMGSFGGPDATVPSLIVRTSRWARARRSGLCQMRVKLGDRLARNALLAVISDTLGEGALSLRAPLAGVVLGLATNPLLSQGDAVVHVGEVEAAP